MTSQKKSNMKENDLKQITSVIDEQQYMNPSLSNDALYKQSMVDNLMNTGEITKTFSEGYDNKSRGGLTDKNNKIQNGMEIRTIDLFRSN